MKNVELDFLSREFFFSYKWENKPLCLQNKCNYFLTSSILVISRVINLPVEKTLLHWIFICHRKAPDMSKTGGNTFEINIPIQVNQIPSVPKWVNFFAQCHGIFLRQKCREWWMFLHGFTWRYYEMQHRNYRWNFHVLCPTGGQAGWGWQYFLLALEQCICENTIRAYGPLDPCALKWLFSTKNDIICKNK